MTAYGQNGKQKAEPNHAADASQLFSSITIRMHGQLARAADGDRGHGLHP